MTRHILIFFIIIFGLHSIEAKPVAGLFDKPDTFVRILLNQHDINGKRIFNEDSLHQHLVNFLSSKDSINIFFCHLALSSINRGRDKSEMLNQIIKAYSYIPNNKENELLPYLRLTEAISYYNLGKYNATLEKTSALKTSFSEPKDGGLLIITKLYTRLCQALLNKTEVEISNIFDEITALTTADEKSKALLVLHAININGIILIIQNQTNKAEALFLEGIEKAKQLNEGALLINFQGNLSNIYLLEKRFDEAIKYAMIDFDHSQKAGDERSLFGLSGIIAESYFSLGNLDSANKYIELIIEHRPNSNEAYFIRHNQNFIYDYLQKTNQTKKLVKISSYFDRIQDSLAQKQSGQDYEIIRSQIDLEGAQNKIEQLKKNNTLENLKNQATQKYIMALSFAIIIILLFVLFIYKNLSEKKKQNQLLEKKSAEIKNQNQELHAQQEDIVSQANRISELNALLEQRVDERTKELILKNKKLSDYAFYNSHNIRGPLARILGLIHIWESDSIYAEEKEGMLLEIQNSAKELDEMVKTVNRMLE